MVFDSGVGVGFWGELLGGVLLAAVVYVYSVFRKRR
jgi:hypothetical protein